MFETLKTRYSTWKRYTKTMAELNALSSRDLEDLGIAPWEIKTVARKATR